VFLIKTVPVIFFGALAKEWQLKCKTSFLNRTKKNVLVIGNVISEMKQTAALSLGILGLNESFVQLNEIMVY
jgi:hypothetical protein